MEDWAEVHRLFQREGLTKTAIARRLGMSRTTAIRLLRLPEPPRYLRPARGSQLDPFRAEITAILDADPTVAATVVRERLQRAGYRGGISVLKEHLARVRPEFRAARPSSARTTCPARSCSWIGGTPGSRSTSARATGEKRSAWSPRCRTRAPTVVFTLGRTMRRLPGRPAGLPDPSRRVAEKAICENDASIVARRESRRAPPSRGRGPVRRAARPAGRAWPRAGPRARATPSAPSATWRRASRRCATSATSATSRPSTTPGRSRSPLGAHCAAPVPGSASAGTSNVARCTGCAIPLPDTDLRLEARAGKDA